MILFLWLLNFAISLFNAWSVGKTWNESKAAGGFIHLVTWCGAIMAACGFTWCYLIIAGGIGSVWPIEQEDGTSAPALNQEQLQAFFNLGYMVIILPVIGSGLGIMIHSWGVFWRRRNFTNGAVAGYNTFAQVYNIAGAMEYMPKASSGLGKFFSGDDKGKGLVVFLVILALAGGILTTYWIITKTAKSTARERGFQYRMEAEAANVELPSTKRY